MPIPMPYESMVLDTKQARLDRVRRTTLTSARYLLDHLKASHQVWYSAMVTLTYAPGQRWEPQDIRSFMLRARAWLAWREIDVRYLWVAELHTGGGANDGQVHYHVLFVLPPGVTLPKPDKAGWWSKGLTRVEKARNAWGYVAKYCSKGETEGREFPHGARICGRGGMPETVKLAVRWWLAPRYVREVCDVEDDLRRAPGGGWLAKATGEWFASPWVLSAIGRGYVRLVRSESIAKHLLLHARLRQSLVARVKRAAACVCEACAQKLEMPSPAVLENMDAVA